MKYELLSGKVDQQRAMTIGRMLFNRYDIDRKGSLDKNQCYSIFNDYCYRILVELSSYHRTSKTHQTMMKLRPCRVYWIPTVTSGLPLRTLNSLRWSICAHTWIWECLRCLSPKSNNCFELRPKKYTRIAQQRLDVARRLFQKFDKDRSGYLTEEEIPGILIETYKEMGQSFNPTRDDVRSWVHSCSI